MSSSGVIAALSAEPGPAYPECRHRRGHRTALAGVLLAAALATAAPADATRPGTNGDIVFSSERDGNREIYRMAADGSNQTRLTNNPAVDAFPSANRGGSRTAFASNRAGNFEIYTIKRDGSGLKRLTRNRAIDTAPAFAPDGRTLVFMSERAGAGNFEIYTMKADGSDLTRITKRAGNDVEPTWAPSGQAIAFTSPRTGNEDIFQVRPNGKGLLRLTENPAADFAPDYSPDGRQLMFSSDRSGNFDVFVIDLPPAATAFRIAITGAANDDNAQNVTNRPERESHGKFSPDGKRIVWEGQTTGGGDFEVHTKPLTDNVEATPITSEGPANGQPFWISGFLPECSDGVDNDGDGKIDHPADPDCTSRQDDEEACLGEAAFTDLDAMERFLRETAKRFGDGKLSTEKMERRTDELDEMKFDLLEAHFPSVFGLEFVRIFSRLEALDRVLLLTRLAASDSERRRSLDAAKNRLAKLQALLEDAADAPEAMSTDLDVMERFLRQTASRFGDGKLSVEQMERRTEELEEMKFDLLEAHFPSVCGLEFVRLFGRLEALDRVLLLTRLAASDGERRRSLDAAKNRLAKLEALLGNAAP